MSQGEIEGALRFTGEPVAAGQRGGAFQLVPKLVLAGGVASRLQVLAGSPDHQVFGSGSWDHDDASGELVSGTGEFSRLTIQAEQGDHLGFELEVRGGDGRDLLEFSIDGVVQASTSGAPIRVSAQLEDPGTHVLSWVFRRHGGGEAVIRAIEPGR